MRDVHADNLDYLGLRAGAAALGQYLKALSGPILRPLFEIIALVGVDSVLAGSMIGVIALLSRVRGLPLITPSSGGASLVGVHYIYPLIAVAILAPGMALKAAIDSNLFFRQVLRAMLCYAVILYAHFNVKLWIPHLNAISYDAVFWDMDVKMHGLVDAFGWVRAVMAHIIPYSANFYMVGFIAMFYIGLIWQVKNVPQHMRELMIACMIMQILGTIGYVLTPAVGPFRFEQGISPLATEQQGAMFDFYLQSVSHGAGWIGDHGSQAFTAGLAAMPSLHVAGATLFFMNARRHSRGLALLFGFLLFFIVVNSVAARWHYLIDLPFGVAVAWLSLTWANWLVRLEKRFHVARPFHRPALA